jgi:hypothetical protein
MITGPVSNSLSWPLATSSLREAAVNSFFGPVGDTFSRMVKVGLAVIFGLSAIPGRVQAAKTKRGVIARFQKPARVVAVHRMEASQG